MLKHELTHAVKEGSKHPYFNKLLINQIAESAKRGETRQEIINCYGVSKGSLGDWMWEYSSPLTKPVKNL